MNKGGRVTRKERPKPELPEEPPLVVDCLCPHCEGLFRPEDLAGSYLSRRCPYCSVAINEAAYDDAATAALSGVGQYEMALKPLHERKERWERLRNLLDGIPFVGHFVKRRSAKAEREHRIAWQALCDEWKKLGALATARYYAGEWYLRTHNPLECTKLAPFRLTPEYRRSGEWHLPVGKGEVSGMTAEFSAFQKLLERVCDSGSPLFRAQLLPNLYFPREPDRATDQVLWDQVDLVVATRQAAFVLEVKSRSGRTVVAKAPFENITIDGVEDRRMLAQNSRHAVAFADRCFKYPFEKVYEQLVFVRLGSFASDECGFVDHVNVSCCGAEDSSFVDALERECTSLPPIMSQEELDRLGENVVLTYGDLNQKRAHLHASKVKKLYG